MTSIPRGGAVGSWDLTIKHNCLQAPTMARASSGLAFLICIYSYTLAFCIHVTCASFFAFNFSTTLTSPCGKDLQCRGDASFADQMIELTSRDHISRNCNRSQGRVWYARPVPLWDAATAELASFATTFSFTITPDGDLRKSDGTYNSSGDGMGFFIAPYSSSHVLNSSGSGGGGLLSLFNDVNKYNATGGSRVVAVEFDTYRNKWDSSAQHVGINVSSIRSAASTNTSVVGDKIINLASNCMMTAKINYDNRAKILAIDLDIDGTLYHVNHTVDLKSFLPEKVAVGFSAATGLFSELHQISYWSFDSSLEEKAVPPASAPSQKFPYPSNSITPVKPKPSTKYSTTTGSSTELQRVSFSSFDSPVEERAVPLASAPSQKTPYLSIPSPSVKLGPSTKYSTALYTEQHKTLLRSFDSSLEQKAVPPVSASSPKILDSSTKFSSAMGFSTEVHRIRVLVEAPASEPNPSIQPAPASESNPSASPVPASDPNPSPQPAPALQPNPTRPPIPTPQPNPSDPPARASQPYHPPSDLFPREKEASPPPPTNSHRPLQVVAPILSISVCLAVGLLLWLWQKRRRNGQQNNGDTASGSQSSDEQHEEADFEREVAGPRRYHYREFATATGDFKDENRLGKGGSGSVYQGTLHGDSDKQVAVKKFSSETSSQRRKEFESEVKIISRLRHGNLVQLLGWCDSAKGLLLVYELVPEGSLDKHIYNNSRVLTWSERYKIIMGLGSALRYLHREWDQCVVHGDIKPSNIMLDSSYNTKLGDFGLARLADHGTGLRTTTYAFGTPGYIDPEFINTRRLSTESDIYSFGIVLLEIISGMPPVVKEPPFVLHKWVWSLHSQATIIDAADERLRGDDMDERQMERALVVGLWCAHHDPAQRPSIVDAMLVLQSEDAKLPELRLHVYKLAARPSAVSTSEISGVSDSSFSSGVRSSATTGTTRSSDSFPK